MPWGIVFHDLPGKNEGAKRCSILCECVPAATGKQKTMKKQWFSTFLRQRGGSMHNRFQNSRNHPNETVTVPSKNLALRRGF